MGEIERAIAYYELLHEACDESHYAGLGLSRRKKEKYSHQRMMTAIALSALREKKRREEGCDWCAGGAPLILHPFADMQLLWVSVDGGRLLIDAAGQEFVKDINCCPMCGRELHPNGGKTAENAETIPDEGQYLQKLDGNSANGRGEGEG